jgi:hypothetical protein
MRDAITKLYALLLASMKTHRWWWTGGGLVFVAIAAMIVVQMNLFPIGVTSMNPPSSFAARSTGNHDSTAPGGVAGSVTGAPKIKQVLDRLRHLDSDETVVFLGVRVPGYEVEGVGIGRPTKNNNTIAYYTDDPEPKDCEVCYLGKAGDESIYVIVTNVIATNRIPLRIGAGIWFSTSNSRGVAATKGVDLPQLERGKAYLLGRFTVDVDKSSETWEPEPNLGGWLQQLFSGPGPTWKSESNPGDRLRQLFSGSPPPFPASAQNLHPPKPTQLEFLHGRLENIYITENDNKMHRYLNFDPK